MHEVKRPEATRNDASVTAATTLPTIAPLPLAYTPDILARFAEDLERCGVVGETKIAKLLFLALISSFLERPLSVAVKGPSSGGKSHVLKQVLRFVPPSAYHELTAMSEKALIYTNLDLKHRFIILYEAGGMGPQASYIMRSLLSEGCIKYEFVDKTEKGLQVRHIEIEGPTGFLTTTTSPSLHPENETRMFSVTVQDSPDQTRAVLMALAGQKQALPDFAPWHKLHEWLVTAKHEVVIPYAVTLAELIHITSATRLRRDFNALLIGIQAHAILHQATRTCDDQGRIVATLEDYAVVRDLVADVIAEGISAAVSSTMRETVDAVSALASAPLSPFGTSSVTAKQVADRLGIDKSNATRRIKAAIKAGYLVNDELRKGQPMRLALGDPMPVEDMDVLPTVERLRGCGETGRVPPTAVHSELVTAGVGTDVTDQGMLVP
jgi:hypothetical protein